MGIHEVTIKTERGGSNPHPLVSVIIPVYNQEKYLKHFIKMLLNQTYTNLDFVFLDDGSNDRSAEIIKEFSKTDPRIQYIWQENQGVASARNHALDVAKADLITYVDPDDFVTSDYIEVLVTVFEETRADMAATGFIEVDESNIPSLVGNDNQIRVSVMDTEEALKELCTYRKGCGLSLWGKLFKKEMLKNHPCPPWKSAEDVSIVYQIVAECKTVAAAAKECYVYIVHAGSLAHRSLEAEEVERIIGVANEISAYINSYYPKIASSGEHAAMILLLLIINRIRRNNVRNNRRFFYVIRREVKKHSRKVLADPLVNKLFKIKVISVVMGYIPFVVLHKIADLRKELSVAK